MSNQVETCFVRQVKKVPRCWCGRPLIDGIRLKNGDWFPFGFLNCPIHTWAYDRKHAKLNKKLN